MVEGECQEGEPLAHALEPSRARVLHQELCVESFTKYSLLAAPHSCPAWPFGTFRNLHTRPKMGKLGSISTGTSQELGDSLAAPRRAGASLKTSLP